ncbi:N-hydroxyarylamine O-acetyltransferase [Sporobacter termitidis DSM 10068]|uniref:N-hydroxyarylamine O-acetyltransferase n=1 Tax=Sporobacter termitidis DSM 10068 TaxID=1123282 RepID=A0A1M5WXP6_9FIRM|nr:arylamine N-acetyltransferase [Sporobacter termitidis]SHH92436.1 N-hydroxyarylamine O-acetyltransferase [Sporobacter termitidis DSM 10068]
MYEELYAPLPDKKQYLERLGVTGDLTPDVETLNRLILAQLRHVPFENLDVYDAETDILLDIAPLFDKLVVRRRGGYCFELNALFMSVLKEIGFDCHPVMVRVVWMSTGYMPITHRAGIVTIGGTRYFCDVGFGGPAPCSALKLDETGPQQSGMNSFIFEKAADGDFVIYRLTETGREQLLKFDDRPCENVDFLGPNEYLSKNNNSGFKKTRMVNISREDGSAALTGNVLRIHKGGEVEETVLDTEEKLREALRAQFGIDVGFPLKI